MNNPCTVYAVRSVNPKDGNTKLVSVFDNENNAIEFVEMFLFHWNITKLTFKNGLEIANRIYAIVDNSVHHARTGFASSREQAEEWLKANPDWNSDQKTNASIEQFEVLTDASMPELRSKFHRQFRKCKNFAVSTRR